MTAQKQTPDADPRTSPGPALLDCNVAIGRRSGNRRQTGCEIGAAELLAEMDRIGIAEAMVYHVLAREYDPLLGNAHLPDALARQPRLHPVWTVLPAHTGEFPRAEDALARMRASGVRMARVFPSSALSGQRFSLLDWCAGELLGALEAGRIPLAVDFDLFRRGEPPWGELHDVVSRHPELNIVLMSMQNRNNRTLYPLLERYPGIHLETLGYNVHHGIEDIVRNFGANRLVLGSGYPQASMGAARLQLDRADVTSHDRALIGGTNLRRLLGLPAPAGRS